MGRNQASERRVWPIVLFVALVSAVLTPTSVSAQGAEHDHDQVKTLLGPGSLGPGFDDGASRFGDAGFDAIANFYPVRTLAAIDAEREPFDIDRDPATGYLWAAAPGTNEIYALDASGREQKSIGSPGSGVGQLDGPAAISISDGLIFVAEFFNDRVQVLDLATGAHVRFIGRPGTGNGTFRGPCGVEVIGNRVYVADGLRNDIQVFSATGTFIRTIGAPGTGDGQLDIDCFHAGLAVRNGEVYVADASNDRVSVFRIDGTWRRHIGVGTLRDPIDLEFDAVGNLWVTDRQLDTVSRWSRAGVPRGSLGGTGNTLGKLRFPFGLEVDPTSETVWVGSTMSGAGTDQRIEEFTTMTCRGQQLTHAGSSYRDGVSSTARFEPMVINMGSGDDVIRTGDGDDVICGGTGDDFINAFGGNDEIRAGLGRDSVWGGTGDDDVFGEGGDDLLFGGGANDRVFGQGGNDEVRGGIGNDALRGGAGDDIVEGFDGNDLIFGNTGDDTLLGQAGQDRLRGQANRDELLGGAGNDLLIGGGGTDVHDGGSGIDRCVEGANQGLNERYEDCEIQP